MLSVVGRQTAATSGLPTRSPGWNAPPVAASSLVVGFYAGGKLLEVRQVPNPNGTFCEQYNALQIGITAEAISIEA